MAENHRNHENDELGRLDASDAKDRKILLTVLLINLTQSAAGIALGIWAGSTALMGAGLDNLADASVYAVSLYAVGRAATVKVGAARLSGFLLIGLAALLLLLAGTAQAAGSSMPWEGPLQSILESIQGPVARIVAVIIIIATGLALAFGDTSGGFRKLIQIVFGLSIAFAASSFFLSFFSFSGGAVV